MCTRGLGALGDIYIIENRSKNMLDRDLWKYSAKPIAGIVRVRLLLLEYRYNGMDLQCDRIFYLSLSKKVNYFYYFAKYSKRKCTST